MVRKRLTCLLADDDQSFRHGFVYKRQCFFIFHACNVLRSRTKIRSTRLSNAEKNKVCCVNPPGHGHNNYYFADYINTAAAAFHRSNHSLVRRSESRGIAINTSTGKVKTENSLMMTQIGNMTSQIWNPCCIQ